MASWSGKRKTIYGFIVILGLLILVAIPLFLILYKAPSCSDGKMNGNENGIDCGGSCLKLCQSAFLTPKILWGGTKFERIAKGIYNASSYIENNNIYGASNNIPYKMSFYDASGLLIADRIGYLNIPPHRNVLAFETNINTKERVPIKATFEFLKSALWFKSHDRLDSLSILKKDYTETDDSSSVNVVLENRGLIPYQNIVLYVVLYDINQNVIGFSRTEVDEVKPKGRENAVFTWPFNRSGQVTSIEVLPFIESIRDNG